MLLAQAPHIPLIRLNLLVLGGLCQDSSTLAWKIPWTEEPGRLHGVRKESDMTERLHFHFSLLCIGEGTSDPLQWSCLENPRDGVAQSRTRLKWLSSSSMSGLSCHVWASLELWPTDSRARGISRPMVYGILVPWQNQACISYTGRCTHPLDHQGRPWLKLLKNHSGCFQIQIGGL